VLGKDLHTNPALADHVGGLRYERDEGLAEADDVHGARHGVGHREDQPDGPTELRPQRSGYHIVRPA
jgi:hypothetical protein